MTLSSATLPPAPPSTLAMTIYGMTKKRVSPEINAVSTLLFVTVLALLAIVNIREARQKSWLPRSVPGKRSHGLRAMR